MCERRGGAEKKFSDLFEGRLTFSHSLLFWCKHISRKTRKLVLVASTIQLSLSYLCLDMYRKVCLFFLKTLNLSPEKTYLRFLLKDFFLRVVHRHCGSQFHTSYDLDYKKNSLYYIQAARHFMERLCLREWKRLSSSCTSSFYFRHYFVPQLNV